MPAFNWPKAPLPNRVEGERPPQMVDRGNARLTAPSWLDRLQDLASPLMGSPESDAMGLAGPMQVPGALGIGIVKTAGPKAVTKVGKWGRGPANEALAYLSKKFPRLAQQVEFLMDDTLGPETSARWTPDNYLGYRANLVAEGGERGTAKAGQIKLNPTVHMQGQGAEDSVNSISHEMQHMADNLRQPELHDPAYKRLNVNPFGYEMNPYENLANITGAVEQGRFMQGKGQVPDEMLFDWAQQLRGRFPESIKDVLAPFIKGTKEAPMDVLRSLRAPNRALANAAELDKLNKHLKSPDALRKAILATKKGR